MAAAEDTDIRRVAPARTMSRMQRLIIALAAVALMCGLCAPFFIDTVDRAAPRPVAGALDLSGYDLRGPAQLEGDWRLVWLSAGDGVPPGSEFLAPVPARWSDPVPGRRALPEQGAAEYRMRITGLKPGRYVLFIPTIYAASEVRVDGRVVSRHGVPGLTADDTWSTIRSHDVTIDVAGDRVDVALRISAFHQRDNGIESSPLFGPSDAMGRWIVMHWIRGLLLLTSCLLLACYGLIIFLHRREERSWLWFAVATLNVMPVLGVFAHDNLMMIAFPGMSLTTLRLVEYGTVVVALGAMLAYTDQLFPRESPRWAFRLMQGIFAADFLAYAVGAAVGGVMAVSEVAHYSLWVRIAGLLYVVVIVVRAAFRRREGALVYVVGVSAFFASLIYTDLVANGIAPQTGAGLDLLPLGMLVMLFSHIVIMAERWAGAIQSAEGTSRDLRRMLDVNVAIASEIELEALLGRIVQVTSQILNADRSSLFLYDERTDELWSMVAEGVESREIRFPATSGLAGDCFQRGEAVNVADAYQDPRFNQAIDLATGYRTRTVLSAPITTRAGKRLGVMQAFNRLDSEVFDDADVSRMTAFAAQAAVAIENATLFGEVAAERNYNDSILRSMSSGVVTLDREARVAKLNDAACRILGVDPAEEDHAEAQATLMAFNPWLVEEIAEVGATERSKSLLDADLKTVRGDMISANLSIVPLIAEGERVGLLILVEDITEGKRLQGAMRRFMTQKVVDQIMGREDELLFGAACEASVLFADIRNFTSLAEQLDPRDTVDMLNEIFTDLFEAVAASDGVLDKYIGDAIMAVYGAPLSSGRDALNAVDSAVAMSGMLTAINARREARGLPNIKLGVGVASGNVVAGTIGSPKRMDYTVIGDSVNLASRLEGITKAYGAGIVICEDTAKAVGDAHPLRELDAIKVRGRQRPARIFQVLTPETQLPQDVLDAYAAGRAALVARDWPAAIAAFERALAAAPADGPSALMLERARILARRPPPETWDGVWDAAVAV